MDDLCNVCFEYETLRVLTHVNKEPMDVCVCISQTVMEKLNGHEKGIWEIPQCDCDAI